MIQPPKIDERTGPDLITQTRRLMRRHTPEWPRDADEKQLADALLHVFARFCEIAITRLNQVPDKNYLAFLQLIGVANRPPQAARVPLTFYLAGENAVSAVVPARTQVAAQPLKGEKDPILFETDREFVVVGNKLTSMFAKDGQNDTYADLSHLLPQTPPEAMMAGATQFVSPAAAAFTGDTSIPHFVYFDVVLTCPASQVDRLHLNIVLEPGSAAQDIEWQLLVPPLPKAPAQRLALETMAATRLKDFLADAVPLKPAQDTTERFTASGEIVFDKIPPSSWRTASGEQRFWIAGSLAVPILSSQTTALPRVTAVNISWEAARAGLPLDQAFFNLAKLDLTKDFYPFGERPKFGDTLYLESNEVFASPDAEVTLSVTITNPAGSPTQTSVPPAAPEKVRLAWEFWDGTEWRSLGTAGDAARIRLYSAEGSPVEPDVFTDGTNAFSTNGEVTFRFPGAPQPTTVNGKLGFWVRVRMTAGNYGQEAHRERELVGAAAVAATFAPPVICSIKADYKIYGELPPRPLTTYNDFTYQTVQPGTAFQPFVSVSPDHARPALYFGFAPPAKQLAVPTASVVTPTAFSSRSMSIYLDVEQAAEQVMQSSSSSAQALRWEYWNGTAWNQWTVRDETGGLRHPGLIRFLAPPDVQISSEFGVSCFWLRAVPSASPYPSFIRMALLNTVMATSGTTLLNEILGASNGTPLQTFHLLHTPVLEGQHLEILEPRMPSHAEQVAIRADEGDDAITVISQTAESETIRVRWHQVGSFYASGARDRHYLLDSGSGSVSFGDGIHGQIPARGAKITATRYRAGGGLVGNRPAGNITQLKTAVPAIGKVCNWTSAGGGGDAETNEALMERGSRGTRHAGRAVAAQDFEDLARLASPQVARAKCVPLLSFTASPALPQRRPGCVGIIVVPWSTDSEPQPGLQLVECVLSYLRRSASPTIDLSITGPDYLRIDVDTQILVRNPGQSTDIELAVKLALTAFLHPLTGRFDGSGWSFGRKPHISEFHRLLGKVPGVSYVREINISELAARDDIESSGLFLVSPGTMTVTILLDT